jgi:outer membrane protein assembly factor BamA
MKYKIGILATLLCLVLFHLAVAIVIPQDEPNKPRNGDTKKTQDNPTPRVGSDATVSVRIKVSAQGMRTLPAGSTIQLKGNQDTCKEAVEREQPIQAGEATFRDLPVCRVKLWIYITGFDSQTVKVDLANYRDSLQIMVKSIGPPVVTW